MSDFFIFLSSLDNIDKFPSNCSTDFISELPTPIHLNSKENFYWTVSLVDITLLKNETPITPIIHLMCDIIEPSVIKGDYRPILRSFPVHSPTRADITSSGSLFIPYQFPLITNLLHRIRIYLTDHKLQPLELGSEDTELICSLHFQMISR